MAVQGEVAMNKLLTPDERYTLARAPLPTIQVYGGKGWGGVYIRSNVPLEGRRTYSPWWPDEEAGLNNRREDE